MSDAFQPGFDPSQGLRPGAGPAFNPWETMPYGPVADFAAQMIPGMQGLSVPLGNSRYTNMFRQMQARRFQQARDAAITDAATADFGAVEKTMQGFYNANGWDWNESTRTQAQQNWQQLATFAPAGGQMAMQAVSLFTGGTSGIPLTYYGHEAGRFLRDPTTGMRGWSANTANDFSKSMTQDFYGTAGDRSAVHGLTSAETGELFQELVYSGRMSADPRMNQLTQPDTARQMKDQLRQYSKLMSTMKEIFTENGMPSASIREMLETADGLTGGLQTMSVQEAEGKLRNFQSALQSHSMSLDTGRALVAQNMSMLSGMGLEANFAMPLAEFGLNSRMALMTTGLAAGGPNGIWGLGSIDQIQNQAVEQRAAFLGSSTGNRLGALQRLTARYYGDENGNIDQTKITGDSQTARAMRALARKDFGDSDLQELLQNEGAMAASVGEQLGISAQAVESEFQTRRRNREALSRGNLDRASNDFQRREFNEMVYGSNSGFSLATQQELAENGANSMALAERLRKASADAIDGLRGTDRYDTQTREKAQASAMGAALDAALKSTDPEERAAAEMLKRKYGANAAREFGRLAGRQTGTSEDMLESEGALRGGSLVQTEITLDRDLQMTEQEEQASNRVRGLIQSSVSGTQNQSILGRLFTNLQIAGRDKSKADWGTIVKATMEGVDLDDKQTKAIADSMRTMDDLADQLIVEDEKNRKAGNKTSDESERLQEALRQEAIKMDTFINDPANEALRKKIIEGIDNEGDGKGGDKVASGLRMDNVTLVFTDVTLNAGRAESRPTQQGRGQGVA